MPNKLDLTPSLEKIARAESKIKRVDAIISEWLEAGVSYDVRREVHGHRAHVIARVNQPLPQDIAWEVVEAVGHIRSALDKLMVALVDMNGRGVSGVGFPFGGVRLDGTPEPFPTDRHEGLRKKLLPAQWDILLAQKPYPGGNNLLWALNEITNEDKHRKGLVRVSAFPQVRSTRISNAVFVGGNQGPALAVGGDPDFICPDQEKDTLWLSYSFGPGSVHPQLDHTASLSVVFAKIRPVTGADVRKTVSKQINLVKSIFELFMKAKLT